MRTRRFKTLMALVLSPLGIAIVVLLLLVFERVRGQICLARYKRAQAAQGATLTVKEFTAGTPQGANGAPEVVGAAEALIDGLVMPYNPPPRMKLTDSGRAIVCFREPDWVTDKLTNRWETLAAELRTNESALALIREGLAKTVFDHRLDYGGGPMMRIQHLTTAKSMSYWLQSGCQLALHEGRLDAGADWLVAEIRLQRFLSNDRIMISELVRLALAAIARADTWEALQAEGWTDEALARIQKAWGEPGFIEPLARGLDGERIFASITFDRLRASNRETIDVLFGLSKLGFSGETETPAWKSTLENLPGGEAVSTFMREQVYCRIWRFAWLDQSECRYLKRVGDLTEITCAAAKSKSMTATAVDVDNFLARASASGASHLCRGFRAGGGLVFRLVRAKGPNSARCMARATHWSVSLRKVLKVASKAATSLRVPARTNRQVNFP